MVAQVKTIGGVISATKSVHLHVAQQVAIKSLELAWIIVVILLHGGEAFAIKSALVIVIKMDATK